MRCDEIMKADVQSLGPDDPVEAAARIMRERGVGFVAICDEDGKAIGTLTDRDIVVRVCAERRGLDTPVRDVMSEAVVCCAPGDSLDSAEALMARHQKSRVVVCDLDGRLRGVISLSDLAQHQPGSHLAETLQRITAREVA